MSSARSRAETDGALRCPMRMLYGVTQERRSRNAAVFGMFGLMALTALLCTALLAERTVSLPALQMRSMELVHTQFRFVPEKTREEPKMRKLLAEASDFEIPEEVEVKPEPEKVLPPEPKTEPAPEVKPAPKPEVKPKPEPRPKPAAKRSAPKAQAAPARVKGAETAASSGTAAPGNAAVSVPAAAGSIQTTNSSAHARKTPNIFLSFKYFTCFPFCGVHMKQNTAVYIVT